MKKWIMTMASVGVLTMLAMPAAEACTDFQVKALDGTMMVGRSMEFGTDLISNLRTSTRNRQFMNTAPNGKPGLAWRAKYGYVFLDGMNQDFATDGMNEMGLAVEALYLPGETQYQAVPIGKENAALPYMRFVDWTLSSFKTIDEVKAALATVYVYEQFLPGLGNMVFPLHYAIHDAAGNSVIVEFVEGKMNIYDNKVGILTNSPTYPWHVANLRNYLNLSPYNPNPISANGIVVSAIGQGSGNVGLPGDASPPSRFTKIAFMRNYAFQAKNAADLLNLSEHFLNNVDIPVGIARVTVDGKLSSDYTQWVVFKDLTHKLFYYRTYGNMTLRGIDLTKIDFSENAPRLKMPVASAPYVMNETSSFMQAVDR